MKNTLAQIIRLIAVSVFSTIAMSSSGCSKQLDTNIEDPDFNIKAENLKCRDPFIYYHEPSKLYYLHVNGGGKLDYYISKDLKKWKSCGSSFVPSEDFWGKQDFWAPDLYEYNGRFYIFVTLSAPGTKRGSGPAESGEAGAGGPAGEVHPGEPEPQRGAAAYRGRGLPTGPAAGVRLHGGKAAAGQAVGEL